MFLLWAQHSMVKGLDGGERVDIFFIAVPIVAGSVIITN